MGPVRAADEPEVRTKRAAGKVARAARIEAIVRAGGAAVDHQGRQAEGHAEKVTPTVERMILSTKAEKKVAHIARELNMSKQTVYEVLRSG